MKKNFLLLLWMTLLPLAGWAGDITVTLGSITKYYGDPDPALAVNNFSMVATDDASDSWTGDAPTKATLLPYLNYKRVTQGNDVNGTYTYTVTVSASLATDHPKWNVVIANAGAVNILPKEISTLTVSTIAEQTFNVGSWNAPAFTLTNNANTEVLGENDIESIQYTTSGDAEITGVGTDNKVIVTGKGNYTGTAIVTTFDIVAKALDADGIVAAFNETPALTFTGSAQDVPAFTVKDGETDLVLDTDFEVANPADVTNAGTKTITITAKAGSNYTGTTTLEYVIAKKSFADGDITAAVISTYINKTYTGSGFTFYPANLSIKWGDIALTSLDYNRAVENGTNVPAEDATDEQKPRVKITGKGNYVGTLYAYFNILPRDLSEVTISNDIEADQTYTGLQITPSTEGKLTYSTLLALVENTDYTVVYGDNVNVADGGTITITGKGNYGGEAIVKNFNITKAELTVTPKDYTKDLGNADPTSDVLAAGNYYEFTGFLNDETATTAGVTGAPTFTIANHTENAGTKADVISIATVGTLEAANYSFTASVGKADLIINQAGASINVTSEEQTYGYELPTLDKNAFGFNASGLINGEEITALTFTVKKGETTYAAGDMLDAGEYDIIASDATATSSSYTFSYYAGTLTISPLVINLVAADQEVAFGSEPELVKNELPDAESNFTTWGDNRVKMQDANGNNLAGDKATFVAKYGVWKEDFVESLTWEEHDGTIGKPGYIQVNLKDNISANFNVQTTNGAVTYTGVADDVTFDKATEDVWEKIKVYNGQEKYVTVKLYRKNVMAASGNVYEWNKEDWNTMILPFEVSVRELSSAIGYAIVNVYNKANEKTGDAGFKLTMGTIPANTPFLLKTDADINEGFELSFVDKKKIVAPVESTVTLTSANGISFIGTYENVEINNTNSQGLDEDNPTYYKYYAINEIRGIGAYSTNTYTVYPFTGFFNWTAPAAAARKMTITVQDADGSVTSINSIDSEKNASTADGWYNLNGVKMDGAPTQKGIYIKDGKKVVIK